MSDNISRLDASMIPSGVAFIYSYLFTGTIHQNLLENAVILILSNISRFQKTMQTNDKFHGCWGEKISSPLFSILEVENMEKTNKEIFINLADKNQQEKLPPVSYMLIKDSNQTDKFMIIQLTKHSYCDAISAAMLFYRVANYYNALLTDDKKTQQNILDNTRLLSSPAPNDIYAFRQQEKKSIIHINRWQHIKNIAKLLTYKLYDKTHLATPYKQLPNELSRFDPSEPPKKEFDITPLIKYCHQHNQHLSTNNIMYALMTKVFYTINCEEKNQPDAYKISFRVMVNILNKSMRKKYIGNYISYIPITVDARQPLYEIAQYIKETLINAKKKREDLSNYKLLEFALKKGLVYKNDPFSYIMTSVDNIAAKPNFLNGAKCYKYYPCANTAIQNLNGAKLNNRLIIAIYSTSTEKSVIGFSNTIVDIKLRAQILQKATNIILQYKNI